MQKGQGNRNGTQTIRPKQNAKTENKLQKKEGDKIQKMPTKGGVKIGDNKDSDKWRCKTCKFLNSIEDLICKMCQDPHPEKQRLQAKKQKKNQQAYKKQQQQKPLLNDY